MLFVGGVPRWAICSAVERKPSPASNSAVAPRPAQTARWSTRPARYGLRRALTFGAGAGEAVAALSTAIDDEPISSTVLWAPARLHFLGVPKVWATLRTYSIAHTVAQTTGSRWPRARSGGRRPSRGAALRTRQMQYGIRRAKCAPRGGDHHSMMAGIAAHRPPANTALPLSMRGRAPGGSACAQRLGRHGITARRSTTSTCRRRSRLLIAQRDEGGDRSAWRADRRCMGRAWRWKCRSFLEVRAPATTCRCRTAVPTSFRRPSAPQQQPEARAVPVSASAHSSRRRRWLAHRCLACGGGRAQ